MLGRHQAVAGKDDDPQLETRFHLADGFALVVQDVERDIPVHRDAKLFHPTLGGLVLDRPKQLQRRRFNGPDATGAFAMRDIPN